MIYRLRLSCPLCGAEEMTHQSVTPGADTLNETVIHTRATMTCDGCGAAIRVSAHLAAEPGVNGRAETADQTAARAGAAAGL